MTSITENIEIAAPLEKVRETFQDFSNFPSWTSFIESIEVTTPEKTHENVAVNDTLKVTIVLPTKNKTSVFTPVVTENSATCFRWSGKLFSGFVFNGEHSFSFKQLDNGHTQVTQAENFSGILSYPIFMMIGDDTAKGFKQFNEALKKKCEE